MNQKLIIQKRITLIRSLCVNLYMCAIQLRICALYKYDYCYCCYCHRQCHCDCQCDCYNLKVNFQTLIWLRRCVVNGNEKIRERLGARSEQMWRFFHIFWRTPTFQKAVSPSQVSQLTQLLTNQLLGIIKNSYLSSSLHTVCCAAR